MRTATGILLALAITVALVAGSMLALELMRPGIGFLASQNLPWRAYPSLNEGGTGQTSQRLFSIQLYAWIAASALAAGLLTFRLRVVRSNGATIEAAAIVLLVLILAFAASELLAGGIGCLVMIWGFVAALLGRKGRDGQPEGGTMVRPFLPVGTLIFVLLAGAYLIIALNAIDNPVFNDTYVILAAQMAAIWMPAIFMSMDLIDGPDAPIWLAFPIAFVAGLAILAAIYASFFLGLSGMPLGTPDYPRAYANWQFVRSVACLILAASVVMFATTILVQRLSRRRAAPA